MKNETEGVRRGRSGDRTCFRYSKRQKLLYAGDPKSISSPISPFRIHTNDGAMCKKQMVESSKNLRNVPAIQRGWFLTGVLGIRWKLFGEIAVCHELPGDSHCIRCFKSGEIIAQHSHVDFHSFFIHQSLQIVKHPCFGLRVKEIPPSLPLTEQERLL